MAEKKKLGEQVNQKLLYRESDWWDVGLVVQKAGDKVQCVKVRFGRIDPTTYSPEFANKKPICKCRTVDSCRIDPTKPHFNTLYLVSLLFAPPILHPTNHFLDREVYL